jgi:hypothetical protein
MRESAARAGHDERAQRLTRRAPAWLPLGLSLLVGLAVLGVGASAQRYFREGSFPAKYAPPEMPDGSFIFCRLAYRSVRAEQSGIGWQTDYPYAEINLMTRLSELTRTTISRDGEDTPTHFVVRPTDDTLFNCPFLMASDIGTVGFTDADADRLRQYLLKGGFFWVDDFWGTPAWTQWANEIAKVLPPPEFPIEDVRLTDPLLSAQFVLREVPQISNFQFWRRSGGRITSERGADSDVVHLRAIRDSQRRIIVLMTHNTDVADSWEREGEDPGFFEQYSPSGYALGVNVLVHAMTH